MKNPRGELIWTGRIALGDEPGVYGDAAYAGLAMELPITLKEFPRASGTPASSADVTLFLNAHDVKVFEGYRGHEVRVTGYRPISANDPLSKWEELPIYTGRLDANNPPPLALPLTDLCGCVYFSIRVRVDTSVNAGLYDDFVVTGLSLKSTTHFASLGFHS